MTNNALCVISDLFGCDNGFTCYNYAKIDGICWLLIRILSSEERERRTALFTNKSRPFSTDFTDRKNIINNVKNALWFTRDPDTRFHSSLVKEHKNIEKKRCR